MLPKVVGCNTTAREPGNVLSINSIGAAVSIRADTATAPDRNRAVVASGGAGFSSRFTAPPTYPEIGLSVAPDSAPMSPPERTQTAPAVYAPPTAGAFLFYRALALFGDSP